MRPRTSVIVATFNSAGQVSKIIDALSSQEYLDYEMIIVDNGSNETNIQIIRNLATNANIRVIPLGKNFGPGHAWNVGARAATGEYLCILDPDAVIGKRFLSEMIDQYSKLGEDVAALMPIQMSLDARRLNDFGLVTLELPMDLKSRMRLGNVEVLFPYTCFVVRKKTFLEVGGYDESLFWDFVDADFGWRLWIAGFRVVSTTAAVAYHKDRTEYAGFRYFNYVKNLFAMHLKNWERKNLVMVIPFLLAANLYSATQKKFPRETAWATITTLGRLRSIMRTRREIQKRRRVRDGELGHILWFFMPVPWIRRSWRDTLRKSRLAWRVNAEK